MTIGASGTQFVSGGPQDSMLSSVAVVFAAVMLGVTPAVPTQVTNANVPQVDTWLAAGAYVRFSPVPGGAPSTVPPMASTQQQIDTWLYPGNARVFASVAQSGGGLLSRYRFGSQASSLYNAEASKTRFWPAQRVGSVITDVLTAQYTFGLHAPTLYNAEGQKSKVWGPPIGVAPPPQLLGKFVVAPPQQWDYTLPPFIDAPMFNPQGYIVPFQEAEPQDFPYLTAAVITPQAFSIPYQPLRQVTVAPQSVDLTLPAVVVHSAPGQQGLTVPPIRHFVASQQTVDFTLQPTVSRAVVQPQGVTLPSIRHFAAPPQQFDFTLQAQIQRAVRTAPVAARYMQAAPQSVDLTLQPWVGTTRIVPPGLTNALGRFVAAQPQIEQRATAAIWTATVRGRGLLGTYLVAAPWVPTSWPTGTVWAPVIGKPIAVLGRFYYAAPQLSRDILEDPSGPYFNKPPAQRRFGWALVLALKQLGVQGVNTVISALSQSGIQGAESKFLEGSACFVTAAYFDENNLPFAPSMVSYRIDDLVSETNILPWTPISPAAENQVTVTAAQNQMISTSRSCEEHQVLFKITDGYGDVSYARVVYDLVRIVGEP